MRLHRVIPVILPMALLMAVPDHLLAHGAPVLAVEPQIVAAGGEIVVAGTGMEPGVAFVLTLDSPRGTTKLGEATASGDGEEGGFDASLVIAADTTPGSYTVRAESADGDVALTDLSVTGPTSQASADVATVREPTGALHVLDRSRPPGELVAVHLLALLGAGVGLALLRRREPQP